MSTHTGNTGPLGQRRGIGFGILLFIVTLGIYSLYWVFKTQDEVKEHSGQGVGGVLGLVIYIVVSIVSWFLIPSEIGKMFRQDGREAPFTGWTGPGSCFRSSGRSSGSSRSRAPSTSIGRARRRPQPRCSSRASRRSADARWYRAPCFDCPSRDGTFGAVATRRDVRTDPRE